jgi:hypothetical protein
MMEITLRDDSRPGDQKPRIRGEALGYTSGAIGSDIGSDAAVSIPWHATDMPSTLKALDEVPIGERAPILDIVDETFIRAKRPDVAMAVSERWATWWPSLTLEVYMDRGWDGMRWTVTGDIVGSAEIWLEEHTPGVLLHHYLRADPTRPGSAYEPRAVGSSRRAQRQIAQLRRRYVHAWKKIAWSLKDELERDARQHR